MSKQSESFLSIVDFDTLQHYKNRNPIWIKLYASLWDNPRFEALADETKAHFVGMCVLASKHDNQIPFEPDWIMRKLGANKIIDFESLFASKLLARSRKAASRALASCYQDASAEKEKSRVEEKRVDERDIPVPAYGEFGHVQLTVEHHSKLAEKLGEHRDYYITRLDRWGEEEPGKFKKKKSHYATILNWYDRDVKDGKVQPTNQPKKQSVHDYL